VAAKWRPLAPPLCKGWIACARSSIASFSDRLAQIYNQRVMGKARFDPAAPGIPETGERMRLVTRPARRRRCVCLWQCGAAQALLPRPRATKAACRRGDQRGIQADKGHARALSIVWQAMRHPCTSRVNAR